MEKGKAVCCDSSGEERSFLLAKSENLAECDWLVVGLSANGERQVLGYYEDATGDVYYSETPEDPRAVSPGIAPAVRIKGALSGQTGQVTVLQADGSYRRFSRWDRITQGSPAQPDAILRTLPQCGCGGSIGMPKLFDSFAEMSAYFFCTFALNNGAAACPIERN